MFPNNAELSFAEIRVSQYLRELKNSIQRQSFEDLLSGIQPPLSKIAGTLVDNRHEHLKKQADLTCLTPAKRQEITRAVREKCESTINEFLKEFKINDRSRKMGEIVGWLFTKNYFGQNYTGIVISGFGNKEHFPRLYSYKFGDMICGVLRYVEDETVEIGNNNRARIVPFAQDEMISAFLSGIRPKFQRDLLRSIARFGHGIIDNLVEANTELSDRQKKNWKGKASASLSPALKTFVGELLEHQQKNMEPINNALVHLPKDEVAHVAESLVNLNSFQKRVSLDAETVGGPIDVAVISKGDGFIWIKRKHYFEPSLNHHFFANYYN